MKRELILIGFLAAALSITRSDVEARKKKVAEPREKSERHSSHLVTNREPSIHYPKTSRSRA